MDDLSDFLTADPRSVIIRVVEAKGSTPREQGAWMLASADAQWGTIGGGQLEFMAIDRARALLEGSEMPGPFAVPLGPEIGQCCGGHVTLDLALVDAALARQLMDETQAARTAMAHVWLFGAGHVGTALARALAPLPLNVHVVETRGDALEGIAPGVARCHTALPDAQVRAAPPRSAFIALTHDHALDFLIVAEALNRGDASYVGMIGSKTKKAVFRNWYMEHGGIPARFDRLVCPIGGGDVDDKRPAVIAALTAAEVLRAIS